KMPEITNQLIQRKLVQAQTVNAELEAAKTRWGLFGDAAGGLVASAQEKAKGQISLSGAGGKPQISKDDVLRTIAGLVGRGAMTARESAVYLSQLPNDPTEIYQHIYRIADTARGVDKTLSAVQGSIVQGQGGGGVTPILQTSPRMGTAQQIG